MTQRQRVVLTLTTLAVLMPATTGVTQAQRTESKTYAITGSVGLQGVTMQGLPGAPVSDENGVYSAEVSGGWSGTVTPVKLGYKFDPPNMRYRSIERNCANQNYRAALLTFTISGNVGLAGVTIEGLPGKVVSDAQGSYRARVEYGWTGAVRAVKQGYAFEPAQRVYNRVTRSHENENYEGVVLTYTLSGNTDVPGATLAGLPGDPIADASGRYRVQVPYGWAGLVTPRKEGYAFTPASKQYTRVSRDLNSQNFAAGPVMYTIAGNVGLPGVVMAGLPGDPITDARGYYTAKVPYGWSGTVRPRRDDCRFEPVSRVYDDVKAALTGQDYWSRGLTVATSSSAGGPEVLMIPTSDVDPKLLAQTREDIQVMLEILREKLSEPRTIMGVLYDYGDFFAGSRSAEALYLDGYGAVFVMRVDFPLSFSPAPPAQEEPEQETDPVWQRARQKLYAPRERSAYGRAGTAPKSDEMTFEQFQKDLVQTLRHAANIRNMDPFGRIVVTIIGQSERLSPYGFGGGGGMYSGGYGGVAAPGDLYGGGPYGGTQPSSRGTGRRHGRSPAEPGLAAPTTVLTILAHKADVDSFAKGQTTLEQFRQHVKIFSY